MELNDSSVIHKEAKLKALIIEDDVNVAEAVSLCLQLRWPYIIISIATEGAYGIEALKSQSFDMVILDINLPDIDGFDVLEQIRLFSNVPIIIVTVRGHEEDQARGLEMGADDYIVKPFRPRDLVARVNAVLRRASTSEVTAKQSYLERSNLILDLTTNEVRVGKETVKLTPTECRVLYVLMKNAGHTLSDSQISQEVWGKEYAGTDLVRTYMSRLRHKLNDSPPRIILNKRGQGYRFGSF